VRQTPRSWAPANAIGAATHAGRMSLDLALVLGLLAVAIALFTRGSPRGDAVAFLALVALPLAGLVEVGEAIAGFGNPNIVLIAALFVAGEGLVLALGLFHR